MLELNFDASDFESFNVKLDIEAILDEASAFLISRILTRFLAETDPNGVPWIPSKAGMARRLKGGTGTLFDTGKLFRSLQVFKTAEGERRVGTDVPYAPLMQLGGGPFKLPPRPFLGFSNEDESMIKQIVQLRINESLKS